MKILFAILVFLGLGYFVLVAIVATTGTPAGILTAVAFLAVLVGAAGLHELEKSRRGLRTREEAERERRIALGQDLARAGR